MTDSNSDKESGEKCGILETAWATKLSATMDDDPDADNDDEA